MHICIIKKTEINLRWIKSQIENIKRVKHLRYNRGEHLMT